MVQVGDRFPETAEGISKAQEMAGEDGDWAQYVNWWGDDRDVTARVVIAQAMRDDADISPELLERFGLITDTQTAVVTTEVGCRMPYAGTEGPADAPDQVIIPNGPRAHLPA